MTVMNDVGMDMARALLTDMDNHQRRCFVQVLGMCPTCNAVPVVQALYDAAMAGTTLTRVEADVRAERARQDAKWGEQNHADGTGRPGDVEFANAYRAICKANGPGEDTWRAIALEEVFEAMAEDSSTEEGEDRLMIEIHQTIGVFVQWAEAIHRRRARRGAACKCPPGCGHRNEAAA
jgi:hypothetical protein